ncbi:Hypothetical predicted protein [Lecanosticta acicola]|uniref:Uncharacterized protein n=1 Tax=Lecanosticta acicola TaxID=111012 RepID=A0AAI9E846_9PEZI|nr:Hypothetical predicted protein [Lecanosticta acicola]
MAWKSSRTFVPFRFLDLPPELRNRVYCYALESAEEIGLQQPSWIEGPQPIREPPSRRSEKLTIQLLATCKLVHKEATPILYANNTFQPLPDMQLRHFLNQIKTSSKYLHHIGITFHESYSRKDFGKLLTQVKKLEQLETLTLDLLYGSGAMRFAEMFKTPEALARTMGPMLRGLHRAQKKDKERKMRGVIGVLQICVQNPENDAQDVEQVQEKLLRLKDDAVAIVEKTLEKPGPLKRNFS